MKKYYIISVLFVFVFSLWTPLALAENGTYPIVSIGTGNANLPANGGPVHEQIYSGQIPVYVTAQDSDLDNYHFRVIKAGGSEGHTCTNEGDLFSAQNQGYASTTLGKSACGFAFNQSVYVAPEGFTNSLIATLNAEDLIAFAGEGEYWLIVGALDTPGHRTNQNYLLDPRIKITVVAAVPAVSPSPIASTGSVGVSGNASGGSSNGPIVNSFGAVTTSNSSNSGSNNEANSANNGGAANTDASDASNSTIVTSSSKNLVGISKASAQGAEATTTDTELMSTSSDQLAQAISGGVGFNWLWLLLLLILGGSAYYLFSRRS